MKRKHKISEVFYPKGVCRLGSIENVPDWAHMHAGEPQAGRFPDDASFRMDKAFSKNVKLADALDNDDNFLVVSQRFVDFLTKADALAHNEVHEVAIFNHKGRREKEKYFLVHQIDNPDCIDDAKTVGEKSKIDGVEYLTLDELTLDEKKIPKEYAIFRPSAYTSRVFFRTDIADKIEAAGFTGIEFHDIPGYEDF